MNGMEKVFENLSSIERMVDFNIPSNVILGEDNVQNMDLYVYSDDQRYSNTVSSTSSTRSSSNAQGSLGKNFTNKNAIVHLVPNPGAKTKSKSSKSKNHSKSTHGKNKLNFEYDQEQNNVINKKTSDLDVKRAINRYGTIPKGTQINAYLDSLRPPNDESYNDNEINYHRDGSTIDCLNLDHPNILRPDSEIISLQHQQSGTSPLNYPKISTSTFIKDQNNILEDISNHFSNKPAQHFNFTRQKSDLTHSKTIENVNLNFKSSKASIRQLRNNKNHLHLLKSVASPRLPLRSNNNEMAEVIMSNNQKDDDNDNEISLNMSYQLSPENCSPNASGPKSLSKSESFDFVSFKTTESKLQDNNLMTLDEIINSEDFPPPPSTEDLEFNDNASITTPILQSNKDNKNDKSSPKLKQDKQVVNNTNKEQQTKSKSETKFLQNAFVNELNESFRLKAQKLKDVGTKANTKSCSFLFKRGSKPEPNCPAPAIPTSHLAQSKFYTKDTVDCALDSNQSSAVDAEYVTPVLKKLPLKSFESIVDEQQQQQNQLTTSESKSVKAKSSKLSLFFNSTNKSNSSKSNKSNQQTGNEKTKTEKQNTNLTEDAMSKSIISNSGYDADDESKRYSSASISNYKKFWETHSLSAGNNLTETDSGNGTLSSASNNITSKSNDSSISAHSNHSNSSATTAAAKFQTSSPKLNARGNNKSINHNLLKKSAKSSIEQEENKSSININKSQLDYYYYYCFYFD